MPFPNLANTQYNDANPIVVNTLAQLRLLQGPTASPANPSSVQSGSGSVWPASGIGPYPRARLLGNAAAFDQAAIDYTWDPTSTAADSGGATPAVVQPFAGTASALATGRWRHV